MKITDIQQQKKNNQRINVFLDDEYAFSMDAVDAVVLGIKTGKELDADELRECIRKSQYAKAKDKALGMLSRKNASRKMVFDYLRTKEYETFIADEVCDELEQIGYIDDYAYATLFAEYASEKLWGIRKLRYELSKNGVDANIIEDVICNSHQITAEELAEKINDEYPGIDLKDIKSKQKVMRYFASHGFDFGIIGSAVDIYISMSEDRV